MQQWKEFPLSAVLSVILDKVLTREIGEVRDLCSFLTGAQAYSHQISRAVAECADGLKKQCPQFDHLDPDEITPENVEVWLKQKIREFGPTVVVSPIPDGKFDFNDPVGDLRKQRASATQ